MFIEGHGGPRPFDKAGAAAAKTNELLENAANAIEALSSQLSLSSRRCVSCTRRHGDIFASEGARRPFPVPDRRGRQLPRHLHCASRYVRTA